MTDRESMLESILNDPANDHLRLVYADWLDDHGEPERAEFIRVQVALAKEPEEIECQGCRQDWGHSYCGDCGGKGKIYNPRWQQLKQRERELLVNKWLWLNLPEEVANTHCPSCVGRSPDWEIGIVECRKCECSGLVPDDDAIEITRGMLSYIRLSRDELLFLPAILAAHPIERVTVDGVEFWMDPPRVGNCHLWYVDQREDGELRRTENWPTRSELVEGIVPWINSVLPSSW